MKMKCSKCNFEVDDNAKFCTRCGNDLRVQQQPVKMTAPKPQVCSKCGNALTQGVKFCTSCGTRVESVPTQEVQSEPTPQSTPIQEVHPEPTPQPIPIQEIQPEPTPQPTPVQQVQPTLTPATNKKEKKPSKVTSNVKMQVLIFVGIVIVVVLGIVIIKQVRGGKNSTEADLARETATEVAVGELQGNEEIPDNGEDDTLFNIRSLMDNGSYEEAIQSLIDNEVEDYNGAGLLQESIDNLYSQCVNEANALIDSGDFDTAYSVIDNRLEYFADIRTKLAYVGDTHEQEINDLRDSIESKMVDYYSSVATNAANADDLEKMLDAFNQLEGRMDDEEFFDKREADYTKLALAHMVNMSSSGSSAKDIRDYLDSKLSDTGNNCRVMEFWDYYDNMYHNSIGDMRMQVTDIRNDNGYVIEYSGYDTIDYSDLYNYSEYELYFALYEIYARHGRIFTDTAVSEHFNATSWYNPSISPEAFDETTLSDVEKENVATILKHCRDMGYRS
jgi:hypothetical protein